MNMLEVKVRLMWWVIRIHLNVLISNPCCLYYCVCRSLEEQRHVSIITVETAACVSFVVHVTLSLEESFRVVF